MGLHCDRSLEEETHPTGYAYKFVGVEQFDMHVWSLLGPCDLYRLMSYVASQPTLDRE